MKKNLFFDVMAALMMVSCVEKKTFEPLNGEWKVVTIGDMAIADSVDAFIGFDVAEQIVYGSTGCNHLTGALPAEIDAESLIFGAMGSTRMMCPDMTIEDAMLPAMGVVVDFNVEGDNLNLLDAAGNTVMTLKKR